MHLYKGFHFRVYPDSEQTARLLAWQDALRFLWNLAIEQRHIGLSRCGSDKRYPTAFDQINELTDLRAELPWLADVPRNVCAQLLVELDKAWQCCFKRIAKAPRWKRKGRGALGLCEPHPKIWRLNGSFLHFPKLGTLRAVIHRPLEGRPKTCTLKRDGDQWFAIIMCEIELPAPARRSEPAIGIDRGVTNLIADSDGHITTNPKHFDAALGRIARGQRRLARKKKGSKNREKARLRVARLHRKVRRQRSHLLHGLSAAYAKSHGTVVVERLYVQNMMVRAYRTLARGIGAAGWSYFVQQLRYKLAWSGGQLVEVPAAYSSQTCSACGHIARANRRGQSFMCKSCGHVGHADVNAAKIILSRRADGAAVSGGSGEGRPVKEKLRVVRRGNHRATKYAIS